MVKSLQSRNGISPRANSEAQSNIQSYNVVMNPTGKRGLCEWFWKVKKWDKMLIELGQSAIFGHLNLGCYKPRFLQKLEPKLWNEKPLNSQNVSSLYVTFFKMKRQWWEHWWSGISDIQILNWIQILPLSSSCSIFCFCSFWDCYRVHNPQLHGERGWGYFMAASEKVPSSRTAATSGSVMNNKIML